MSRSEAAKARERERQKKAYRERKLGHPVPTRGYCGPGDGYEGVDARCCMCGHVFRSEDFGIDTCGKLVEPTVCGRCAT